MQQRPGDGAGHASVPLRGSSFSNLTLERSARCLAARQLLLEQKSPFSKLSPQLGVASLDVACSDNAQSCEHFVGEACGDSAQA